MHHVWCLDAVNTSHWPGAKAAKPRTSSRRSLKRTPQRTLRNAPLKGRPHGAARELRGVQHYYGTQDGERMDAKFEAKFGAGRSFSCRACFLADLRRTRRSARAASASTCTRMFSLMAWRGSGRKGLRIPCDFLLPRSDLRCLFPAGRTRKA